MADEKKTANEKLENAELTDEQANEAAGGTGSSRSSQCSRCKRDFPGSLSRVGGKYYCSDCIKEVITIL